MASSSSDTEDSISTQEECLKALMVFAEGVIAYIKSGCDEETGEDLLELAERLLQ